MEILAIGLACFALGVGLTSLIYVMFLGPGSKDYPSFKNGNDQTSNGDKDGDNTKR